MYQQILYEVDDPVATITLNRPEKLNALTSRLQQELRHAIADAERRDDVVGIIVTGAGRGFCAGADMTDLQEIQAAGDISASQRDTEFAGAAPGDRAMGEDFRQGLAYLLTVRKPIVAAINGPCAGMGFSLAIFCDLRFASEQAAFITAYSQRGLVAEHGVSWVLPRLLGPARALDILWSGRRLDGREALELGIANRVFPADRLLEETRAYIRTLAATASPASLLAMKQQIYRHLMQPLGAAMTETQHLMDESVKGPHFTEGIASFLERRAPRFQRVGERPAVPR
ncbi:MAG: enoyl-CoA hydratase-related protein [Dehalococcoidia bacterium]